MQIDRILSSEEVKIIEQNAKNHPYLNYYGTRVMNVSSLKWHEIVTISNKRLILIKGNNETGYTHIKERHLFWSPIIYRTGKEFQAQSKFPQDIAPIDFVKIADEIYKPENLVVKNEHLDANYFDKYVGNYTLNQEVEIVNLILYKNSTIIHSLYPQSNKFNNRRNRKKYPYSRGKVKVVTDYRNRVTEIHVPYFSGAILKYVFLVEKFYEKDIEEWRILVMDENIEYKFDVLIGSDKIIQLGETSARITFQFSELKNVEDAILSIEKKFNSK